jgi:hypothetical protein
VVKRVGAVELCVVVAAVLAVAADAVLVANELSDTSAEVRAVPAETARNGIPVFR